MGTFTKPQTFPYSFKTVATGDTGAIGYGANQDRIGFEMINPRDFYSCQQLYAHFRFLHNGSAAGRNVTSIYVTDDTIAPTTTKTLTATWTAASLTVDVQVDLSQIRNEFGENIVFFVFDGAISGTIKIIKLDMLYQVIGNR